MQSLLVAVGNFFFRYRNTLFPLVFILGALTLRPKIIFASAAVDRLLVLGGAMLALLGQALRLATIGFDYIHRGGKDGQVYANRLVRGGVYGVMRNPMYVANALIAVGMTFYVGAPLAYVIIVPLFLLIYHSIVVAEEAYLHDRFGAEYDNYRSTVNRYIPALSSLRRAFVGMRFDWRKSIKKDLGTVVGLAIGLILIPVWREYFLYGPETTKVTAMRAFWLILAVVALYVILRRYKKGARLFGGIVRQPKPAAEQKEFKSQMR